MARFEDAEAILEAAARWRDECLLGDGSILSDRSLWTPENFGHLEQFYVENLDAGEGSFLKKFEAQLAPAPPEAKQLAAEVLWVLYLMVTSVVSPDTKRSQIRRVWGWSGEPLPDAHWALGDVMGAGVANPGTAYNTHRWRELRFFITAMVDWKALNPEEREELLDAPWGFARWLEEREHASGRQLRHVLPYLLFPETFERIATPTHKRQIVRSFRSKWNEDPEEVSYDDLVALDREILRVRERLEEEYEDRKIDFYEPPADVWRSDDDGGIGSLDADALQGLRETFLRRLPCFESFRSKDGLYWNWERGYKEELKDAFDETVVSKVDGDREEGWAEDLRESIHDLLTRRLEMTGNQQNLLSWRYYTFLRDMSEEETERFARAFAELLRGEGETPERVERFNEDMLPVLERHDAGNDAVTRSFPTLFLMLDDPEHEIFIRTQLFNRLGKRLTGERLFENRPLGSEGYERGRNLALAVRSELEAWRWEPRDMIDVQSFMWTAGSTASDKDSYAHWIFQANPDYFDLEGYARARDRITLLVNQHAGDIELGDHVYLWEAGEEAGILGRARVIDGPREMPADEAAEEFDRGEPDRFQGQEKTRARLCVGDVFDERVDRDRLREDPALEDLSILRAPQGTNFPVSEEEAEVLEAYLRNGEPGGPTILKVAPGEGGKYWDECLRDDVMVVGWNGLGDLRDYSSVDELRDAVDERYGEHLNENPSAVSRIANRLWDFRNLEPGDRIVANRGESTVLGVGEVRAPGYKWEPDRDSFQHTVAVGWDKEQSGDVRDRGAAWRPTIVRLDEEEYRELLEDLSGDVGFDPLLEELERKGFHYPPETVANYLLALQTKGFVILSGISGTGKTRLAIETAKHFRPPAEADLGPGDHYEVVDVRPDWTDNRGLLGYYNPITERYRPTPFLDLLLRAQREEERAEAEGRQPSPFFVILDEMNLARVEHYFSDFLSALESEEPIRLHDDEELESGDRVDGRTIPRRLEIPGNVFFTGTVNVDETTYMFSPKVLDRAFTLELNRVDLRGYGESASFASTPDALSIDDLETPLSYERRPNTEDWRRFGELGDGDLQRTVVRLNELLTEENLHFGYRVADEIARFVLLATSQADDGENAARAALDLAVMQKVLPKFHGTEQELGSVLRELFAFAVTGEAGTDAGGAGSAVDPLDGDWQIRSGRLRPAEKDDEQDSVDPHLARTAAKIRRMMRRLRDQGFTSFIE